MDPRDFRNLALSAGSLRRLAGGESPAALRAALRDEGWSAADVECATDGSGKSPLHFAAWRGDPENVAALADLGCAARRDREMACLLDALPPLGLSFLVGRRSGGSFVVSRFRRGRPLVVARDCSRRTLHTPAGVIE